MESVPVPRCGMRPYALPYPAPTRGPGLAGGPYGGGRGGVGRGEVLGEAREGEEWCGKEQVPTASYAYKLVNTNL